MKKGLIIWSILIYNLCFLKGYSQVNEDKTGAWYMYFWNTNIKQSSFGFQGDIQYRNWNIIGDLEQLLLRGGFTFNPSKSDVKFTLGYANVTSGEYGDSKDINIENRISRNFNSSNDRKTVLFNAQIQVRTKICRKPKF